MGISYKDTGKANVSKALKEQQKKDIYINIYIYREQLKYFEGLLKRKNHLSENIKPIIKFWSEEIRGEIKHMVELNKTK